MKAILSAILSFIFLVFISAAVQAASNNHSNNDNKVKELEQKIDQMQNTIDQMTKKIDDMDRIYGAEDNDEASGQKKKKADNRKTSFSDDNELAPQVPPESNPEEEQEKIWRVRKSPIELRESFSDKQEAAPRPYGLTLDPEFKGFIPIPHTHGMIKFNARPRVDMTMDNTYTGNDNRFVPAQIPVTGEPQKGGGYQFNMNAQGTQLSMDVRAPGIAGNPRFYYENDFSANGNQYLNYRVRHLYGQFYNIIVGQTYTIFEDADAWPDTVDYEGTNSMISARRPLIRYAFMVGDDWLFGLSIERPDAQVDTSNDPTATSENHAPEGGFHIRWAKMGIGHIQFATIFREIGVSGDVVGNQKTFGWGTALTANLNTFKKDSIQAQAVYGQGIFYFMNDAVANYDAAFNSSGKLVPLPVIALMGGYTHYWSSKFRSTGSFGFINVENAASENWDAYHRTYYGSINLVYQLFKRLSFGIEGLYGYKQVKSHASGHAFRGQLSIMYSLFK